MVRHLGVHLAITVLYLGFGLSLGCYYTATYFGRSGWPLPSCEAISGVILYYFSVMNAATETQAVHWMVVFAATGYLWITSLWYVPTRFARRVSTGTGQVSERDERSASFATFGLPVAAATIPLSLPIPFMIRWTGSTSGGFSWSRFVAVCLRHAWVDPPTWLNYVYFSLAMAVLVIQIAVVQKQWRTGARRLFAGLAIAFGMLLVSSVGAGILLSYPLRALFE